MFGSEEPGDEVSAPHADPNAHAPHGVLDRRVGRSIFGHDAGLYDRARSAYPPALYDALAARVPERPRILEIGAGTGLATAGLLALDPSRLVLVEPDAGMAALLAKRFAPPVAEVMCRPFLEAPEEGSFDLVACAAAFHWLDPEPALARIAELLAPLGCCALWWNSYFGHGLPDPFGDTVLAMLLSEEVALPPSYVQGRHYAFDQAHHLGVLRGAGFAAVENSVYSVKRHVDATAARELFATFSFIEVLGAPERGRILDLIGKIVDRDFDGRAEMTCATSLFAASHSETKLG